MKCDKLKYERLGDAFNDYPYSTLVIRKQYVDAAIDELKRDHHRERHEYIEMVAQLKARIAELEESHKKEVGQLLIEIAELKKRIDDGDRDLEMMCHQNENLLKIVRHHKYKRILAMAEACMHKRWRTDDGFDYARSNRHMNKWLAIAEQFKEAK